MPTPQFARTRASLLPSHPFPTVTPLETKSTFRTRPCDVDVEPLGRFGRCRSRFRLAHSAQLSCVQGVGITQKGFRVGDSKQAHGPACGHLEAQESTLLIRVEPVPV